MKKSLYPEFQSLIAKYDICCFVETRMDDFDRINISGYNVKMKNRNTCKRSKSGGIALVYKDSLENRN